MQNIPIQILQDIVDIQKDLFILLYIDEPILINSSFKKFFQATSLENYKREYRSLLDSFMPHPLYFSSLNIEGFESWYEALLSFDEDKRIVSMVNSAYEPKAFSVNLMISNEYKIISLKDITQDLIKRIMVENSTNIDEYSGAYSKNYFMQIRQSYEDAAKYNKKLIALYKIEFDEDISQDNFKDGIIKLKRAIRQDDMLCSWSNSSLYLFCLIDTLDFKEAVKNKIRAILPQTRVTIFANESIETGANTLLQQASM